MLKRCKALIRDGTFCKRNVWSGSKKYCHLHDPHFKMVRGGAPRTQAAPAPSGNGKTTESVADAKANVAALIERSERGNIRPRDLAELYRVYATLSELETKVAAEGIEGLIVVDLGPHQHVVVVDD